MLFACWCHSESMSLSSKNTMHNAAYNEKSVIYREVKLLLNSNATKRKNICNYILKNWDLRKEITF